MGPRAWVMDQFLSHIEDWRSHPRQAALLTLLLITHPVYVYQLATTPVPEMYRGEDEM